MHPDILTAYAPRVFGYAVRRTETLHEAEELSQEILFTALCALPGLRNETRFEPWLWGVADNVTKAFRRKCARRRALYSYDALDENTLSEEPEYFAREEQEAEYAALRREVAMLSRGYRDILVLHYFDGLSVDTISETLSIPRGTVTWRLSEGRKKVKKGLDSPMNETALYPKAMHIGIFGSADYDGKTRPYPSEFIRDALAQNILLSSYETPRSVEDLAHLCGVPAYYIEDRVRDLVAREAMTAHKNSTYQTDFPILSDKHSDDLSSASRTALTPLVPAFCDAFNAIAREAAEIPFYRAGYGDDALYFLCMVMAFSVFREKFCTHMPPPLRTKKDGFAWSYFGTTETHPFPQASFNISANCGSRGTYRHMVWWNFAGIGKQRDMMYDYEINVCEDILLRGTTEDRDSCAIAIRDGYVKREDDGTLTVLVPAMTCAQTDAFDAIARRHLAPIADSYNAAVGQIRTGYRKLFPTHTADAAENFCGGMFFGLLHMITALGQELGHIPAAPEGMGCDVMVQMRGE